MSNKIEDIEVYNLAMQFGDDIWKKVTLWDFFVRDTIGKQLVRSADSISANIAEGFGRYHFKENKNFCYFSRGSIIETKGWLNKAYNRQLLTEQEFTQMIQMLETIHFKLNAYIKRIGTSMTVDQ